MAERIESSEHRPEQLHLIVEAFLDGELVDPALLRIALADQPSRDHLVDLLIIRGALKRMDATVVGARSPVENGGRARRLAAIAAATIISVSVGYFAGQKVMASAVAPATVEAIVVGGSVSSPPQPTRSIALQPGVNWTESPEGR